MRLPFALLVLGFAGVVGCDSRPAAQSGSSDSSTPSSSATASAAPASFDPDMAAVCQGSCAAKFAYQEADVVPQPGAHQGDLTRCVVSGVVFKAGDGNPKIAHAGNDYILCCNGCAGKFHENPGRFVKS